MAFVFLFPPYFTLYGRLCRMHPTSYVNTHTIWDEIIKKPVADVFTRHTKYFSRALFPSFKSIIAPGNLAGTYCPGTHFPSLSPKHLPQPLCIATSSSRLGIPCCVWRP